MVKKNHLTDSWREFARNNQSVTIITRWFQQFKCSKDLLSPPRSVAGEALCSDYNVKYPIHRKGRHRWKVDGMTNWCIIRKTRAEKIRST